MPYYSSMCSGSLSSHCTATADPVGRKEIFLQVSLSLLTWGCQSIPGAD